MTFTVSPWLVWAGASLALFGVVWVLRGTMRGLQDCAAWLADWLQSRIDPPWWWKPWLYRFRGDDQDAATEDEESLLEDCDHEYTPNEAGTYEWCQKCDSIRPTLLGLPPERSWEQMTAHQLPVVGMSPAERKDWQRLERGRKRRAKRVEMTYRAHYVAMGYEYPSGLMARVREAAQ